MKKNQHNLKSSRARAVIFACLCGQVHAQCWNITGDSGIAAGTNYLGTTNPQRPCI